MQSAQPVLIVGSLAFDDLEMPTGSFRDVLGGAATYSAFAASLLCPVRVVGVIGDDFAEAHLERLRARGVDTTGIERVSGKTFRWHGRYSHDLLSRETLRTDLNVFADFRPKVPASYANSPIVLLGNIHPALQLDVLAQAKPPHLVVADTMNFWIAGEPEALGQVLRKVDLLVINDEEARQLSGIHNITKAAADIRRRGPKRVIIKRGEYGAVLFDDHGAFFIPGYPLEEVLDPTGAGDTFAGGLVGYLAMEGDRTPKSLRKAMFFASALASFCVEKIGTERLATVTKPELSSRLAAFGALVDYGGELQIDLTSAGR